MIAVQEGYRDAAEFQEASYTHHPVEDMEPESKAPLSDVQIAGLRYALKMEPRPMREVSAELGVSIEAISKVKRRAEAYFIQALRRKRTDTPASMSVPFQTTNPTESDDSTCEVES